MMLNGNMCFNGNSSNSNSNNMGGGQELGEPMAANDGGWSSSGAW